MNTRGGWSCVTLALFIMSTAGCGGDRNGNVKPLECVMDQGMCLPAFSGKLTLEKPLPGADATDFKFRAQGWRGHSKKYDNMVGPPPAQYVTCHWQYDDSLLQLYTDISWSLNRDDEDEQNLQLVVLVEKPGIYSYEACYPHQSCPDCPLQITAVVAMWNFFLPRSDVPTTGKRSCNNYDQHPLPPSEATCFALDTTPPNTSAVELNVVDSGIRGQCGGGEVPYWRVAFQLGRICEALYPMNDEEHTCGFDCPDGSLLGILEGELLCPDYNLWQSLSSDSDIRECPDYP